MAMEITSSYNNYVTQGMSGNSAASGTKKKETEKTKETAENSKAKSTKEYAKELAKLVPSAEFQLGSSFSTKKTGVTLTVEPRLLEKMQNDPAMEKKMKELTKGIETANNLVENYNKMTGSTTVFRHWYIDANGELYSFSHTIRKDELNERLRKEAQENAEKRIEKSRENARENAEKLAEELEEKAEEKKEAGKEGTTTLNKAEQLLEEKMAASKDGTIYLNDTEVKTIIEAAQQEDMGRTTVKEQSQVGANLDLKI